MNAPPSLGLRLRSLAATTRVWWSALPLRPHVSQSRQEGRFSGARRASGARVHDIHTKPVLVLSPDRKTMAAANSSTLLSAFQGLKICTSIPFRQTRSSLLRHSNSFEAARQLQNARLFSTTSPAWGTWLEPSLDRKKKMAKGRPRVATGGSTKGTTVIWGDYGLRMIDHHRRISAKHLKMAEDTIKVRLRGEKYRLYKRKCCNVGVYVSGNEMRMGKGKGSFDHWATRMSVNQVLFEIKGRLHEQIVRDAFRLVGNKLPGQWEFVTKDDVPVVGITKLDGITLEDLKRPRRHIAPAKLLAASSPTPVTEAGSASEASRSP